MISAELFVTLQQIQLYAYKRKSFFMRGGKGLVTPDIKPEPILEDILNNDIPLDTLLEESKQDNQINVFEAIKETENKVIQQNKEEVPEEKKINPIKQKYQIYKEAKIKWQVEKWQDEFKYNRKRTEVNLITSAYDDIINFIDQIIIKMKEEEPEQDQNYTL